MRCLVWTRSHTEIQTKNRRESFTEAKVPYLLSKVSIEEIEYFSYWN